MFAFVNQETTTVEQLNANTYFMGLFDGHGGSETSKYLRKHAHETIGQMHASLTDFAVRTLRIALAVALLHVVLKKMMVRGSFDRVTQRMLLVPTLKDH